LHGVAEGFFVRNINLMNANEKGERRCQKAAAELGVILCIK
jgi:hypothetical protein